MSTDSCADLWGQVDEATQRLSEQDRRSVRAAIADAVLEGWIPNEIELRLLVELAIGGLTVDQYIERSLDVVKAPCRRNPLSG